MRKILFGITILALLSGIASAGPLQEAHKRVIGAMADAGGCSTPTDGDEFNEGFIGTDNSGYENTGWTEIVGTNGTVDSDYTLSGTPPTGSCSEGLLTSVTTSGTESYAYLDFGSVIDETTTVVIKAEFRINSYTLPDNADRVCIIYWGEDFEGVTWDFAASVELFNSSDTLQIKAYSASGNVVLATLSTETWYTLTLTLHGTAASSSAEIDSLGAETFTKHTSLSPRYLVVGPSVGLASDEAAEIEWGRVWIDTP